MIRKVLALSLLAFLSTVSLALADGGSITGQVLNHTTVPPKTLASQPVAVYSYQNEQEKRVQDATTDANGRFSFQNLPLGEDIAYFVTTDYADITYYSDPVTLTTITPTASIALPVYETTNKDSDLRVQPSHVVVSFANGQIRVQEIQFVSNQGTLTYIGNQDPSLNNEIATLRFSLPKEATELSFSDTATENSILRTPDGFVDRRPISPGTWQYIYSYSLNYIGTSYTLRRQNFYPVQGFNLLVSDVGVKIESAQLTSRGTRQTQDGPYQYWSADSLPRDSELVITFSQLPTGSGQASPSRPTSAKAASASPLGWVVLGLVSLAVVLAVAYPFTAEERTKPERKGKS